MDLPSDYKKNQKKMEDTGRSHLILSVINDNSELILGKL